jgi:hypothetical protein
MEEIALANPSNEHRYAISIVSHLEPHGYLSRVYHVHLGVEVRVE